ncbi:MAG: hypothetical protein JNK20_16940 [Flavipsychrobacter sp.]|nr:hypothetical protein [Flavipsychrobacter sp.]
MRREKGERRNGRGRKGEKEEWRNGNKGGMEDGAIEERSRMDVLYVFCADLRRQYVAITVAMKISS